VCVKALGGKKPFFGLKYKNNSSLSYSGHLMDTQYLHLLQAMPIFGGIHESALELLLQHCPEMRQSRLMIVFLKKVMPLIPCLL
jgi:hypothetical protein